MNRVPALLYHSISDDPSPALRDYTVQPELFREHLSVIKTQGWDVVTITELERRLAERRTATQVHNEGQPMLLITFDDGFADNAEEAAVALAEHGFPATLYVTAGTIGRSCDWLGDSGKRSMVSWSQLRGLVDARWEVGSHSVSHPELDVIPLRDARREIEQSRAVLEDGLGRTVDSFAYPHGYYRRAVRDAVIAAGYGSACAVRNTWSTATDDSFARARLTVSPTLSAEALGALLGDENAREARPKEGMRRARAQAWRSYRRVRRLRDGATK
jgi:peptidoglycan/xylan/chitin deacetylase (PgdA/CDA1 family)